MIEPVKLEVGEAEEEAFMRIVQDGIPNGILYVNNKEKN